MHLANSLVVLPNLYSNSVLQLANSARLLQVPSGWVNVKAARADQPAAMQGWKPLIWSKNPLYEFCLFCSIETTLSFQARILNHRARHVIIDSGPDGPLLLCFTLSSGMPVQVSLPHYRDKGFLQAADCNYRRFLLLHQQNPGNFIVPSFDMDLLWHAHQVLLCCRTSRHSIVFQAKRQKNGMAICLPSHTCRVCSQSRCCPCPVPIPVASSFSVPCILALCPPCLTILIFWCRRNLLNYLAELSVRLPACKPI